VFDNKAGDNAALYECGKNMLTAHNSRELIFTFAKKLASKLPNK